MTLLDKQKSHLLKIIFLSSCLLQYFLRLVKLGRQRVKISKKHYPTQSIFIMARITVGAILSAAFLCSTSATATPTTYQYDALGRVVKVTYPDSKQICYQYDDAGNRTRVQKQATSTCTPRATTLLSNSVAALQAEEAAMFGGGTVESLSTTQTTGDDQVMTETASSETPDN